MRNRAELKLNNSRMKSKELRMRRWNDRDVSSMKNSKMNGQNSMTKKNMKLRWWRPRELDEAVKKKVIGKEMQVLRSSKDL